MVQTIPRVQGSGFSQSTRLDFGTFLFSLFGFIRDPIYKYFSGCLKANPV